MIYNMIQYDMLRFEQQLYWFTACAPVERFTDFSKGLPTVFKTDTNPLPAALSPPVLVSHSVLIHILYITPFTYYITYRIIAYFSHIILHIVSYHIIS